MDIPAESSLSPKVEIRDTADRGRGMFALSPIAEGETVVIFGGEYVDAPGARKAELEGKLVMQWDDDLYSVEERGDDPSYFINHSCDGNLWMRDAFTLTARRAIAAGEEITADYALWEGSDDYRSSWECLCGSESCRGRVTGGDWKLPDVQDRYRGHFSPLINTLIERSMKVS